MLLRSLFLCFFLLSLAEVTAQPVLFSTFLSEFKMCARIELASFGDSAISSTLDGDMYEKFLPSDASDCLCKPADIFWQQGDYMKCDDFVIVMLQRHCPDYQDGNSRWLMENLVTDYMLITLTMTRLAVRGKKKIFLLITLMLAMYLLWRACAERADVSRVIMSIIAALSLIIAALTIKERAGCIIFFPVLIWHGFLLAKLFGAL